MKTETLNDSLIRAMKEKIPKGLNLANVLMDTLYIGKEAVYRRLRGEVPFTFTEASLISNSLGVSLDRISGTNSASNALFGLNVIDHTNPIESYYKNIENSLRVFAAVKDDPTAEWFAASNIIPQLFYMAYDNLSRFLLYKWMYQHERVHSIRFFSELKLNDKLKNIQREYVKISRDVASSNFIWDNMMFLSLANDIKYFASIHLIKEKEIEILKKEILALINYLDDLAAKGYHKKGKEIHIFVSNINFEASYSYMQAQNFKFSSIRLYSINAISTADEEVFRYHKDWIHSLKKYSTLISESGEIQRIRFFEKQREYINGL